MSTIDGSASKSFLKVEGEDIVLDGKPILLKGVSEESLYACRSRADDKGLSRCRSRRMA
jgi:hypothetical protein